MPSSGDALPSRGPPKPSTRHTCVMWTIAQTFSSALERWCLNWRNVSDEEAQPQRTEPCPVPQLGSSSGRSGPGLGPASTLTTCREEGDDHKPRSHQPWPNPGGLTLVPALDCPELRAPCQT